MCRVVSDIRNPIKNKELNNYKHYSLTRMTQFDEVSEQKSQTACRIHFRASSKQQAIEFSAYP